MSSDYEAQREARVSKNFEKLRELKIDRAASRKENDAFLDYAAALAIPPRGRRRRRLGSTTAANVQRSSASPARKSKRLRGEEPEIRDDETDNRLAREPEEATVATTRRGRSRMRLVLPAHEIRAPLTLPCGVTVLDLGQIHRGQWSSKYWSSTGCLFHHAYPVGYKATKRHFNRMYTMWIEEGRSGPVFFVREEGRSGATFSGASPTSPWTQVCLRLRTGARISGPLHFGFSDPCVQAAIAKMYDKEELEAAMSGSKFWSANPSPEEKAARSFAEIPGVGDGAAMALAMTTALGGRPHPDKTSLASWAARDGGDTLKKYLLESPELPESLLRWPKWKRTLAPSIVDTLVAMARGHSMPVDDG